MTKRQMEDARRETGREQRRKNRQMMKGEERETEMSVRKRN